MSKDSPAKTNFKRGKTPHAGKKTTNEKTSSYKRSYPFMFPYMDPYVSSYYNQNNVYGTPYPNYYDVMAGRRTGFNGAYIDKKDYVNDNDAMNDGDYAMTDGEPVYQYPLSPISYPKLQRSQTYQRRKVKLSDYGYLNNEDFIAKSESIKQQHAAFVKSKNNRQAQKMKSSSTLLSSQPSQFTNHIVKGEMEKHGERFFEGLCIYNFTFKGERYLYHKRHSVIPILNSLVCPTSILFESLLQLTV